MPVANPGFIAGVKNSISAGAANKGNSVQFTSEGPLSINGVPAYGVQHGLTLQNSKLVLCHTYLIAANRKLYLVLTQALDSSQVPALEAMATTFRFDTPPEIPVPPIPHRRLKMALAGCRRHHRRGRHQRRHLRVHAPPGIDGASVVTSLARCPLVAVGQGRVIDHG